MTEKPISKDYLVTQLRSFESQVLDNKFIVQEDGKGLFSGSYDDLTDKPTIPEAYDDTDLVGTIEDIESSLGDKADKTELHTHTNKEVLDNITNDKVIEWDAKASKEYVDNALDALDIVEKEYVDDDTIVKPMYYDIHVIPDKYNTGCDESTCTGTLSYGETSQGIVMRLDTTANGEWLYIDFNNKTNKLLEGEYIFENLDLSGYFKNGTSNGLEYQGNGIKLIYNNCKFTNWVHAYRHENIQFEFNNCSFTRFNGSDSIFNNCYFGGGELQGDPLNPGENCTFNNCYCSDCVIKTEEQGSSHIDGMQSNGCINLYFNNCRWEVPDINYTYKQGGFSYVIYLEPTGEAVARNVILDHCHINGGGYYSISVTEAVDPANNIRIIEPFIGYCYYGGSPYYPNNAKEVTENAILYDSLYVSSVWKDENNHLHFLVSNDTGVDRTLSVYTNEGVTTFNIPRTYKMTEYEADTKDFADFPIDIEHTIESDVNYAVFYDGEKQVRFVNYDNSVVRKPIVDQASNGEDGKSAYEIACDAGFEGTEEEWLESLKGKDGVVIGYAPIVDGTTLVFEVATDGNEVIY